MSPWLRWGIAALLAMAGVFIAIAAQGFSETAELQLKVVAAMVLGAAYFTARGRVSL